MSGLEHLYWMPLPILQALRSCSCQSARPACCWVGSSLLPMGCATPTPENICRESSWIACSAIAPPAGVMNGLLFSCYDQMLMMPHRQAAPRNAHATRPVFSYRSLLCYLACCKPFQNQQYAHAPLIFVPAPHYRPRSARQSFTTREGKNKKDKFT